MGKQQAQKGYELYPDYGILASLYLEKRYSLRRIAEELQVSLETLQHHIKDLENEIEILKNQRVLQLEGIL